MYDMPIPFMFEPTFVSLCVFPFPILVNHACTGHKLQGQSKHHHLISSWSYTTNWPYVMLFLRKPMELNPEKYGMSTLYWKQCYKTVFIAKVLNL